MIRAKQAKIGTALLYTHENVITHSFHLARLETLANLTSLTEFQQKTGLADFYWRVLFFQPPGEKITLAQALAKADGYVFFMHGWNGSHRIWEKLPFHLTEKHKNIVCFNLDVNGSGMSPFINPNPRPEHCTPAALMTAESVQNTNPTPDSQ